MSGRYICLDCGCVFDEPHMEEESRGEFWGAPCYETMYYCPHCMGDFIPVEEYERGMKIKYDSYVEETEEPLEYEDWLEQVS